MHDLELGGEEVEPVVEVVQHLVGEACRPGGVGQALGQGGQGVQVLAGAFRQAL